MSARVRSSTAKSALASLDKLEVLLRSPKRLRDDIAHDILHVAIDLVQRAGELGEFRLAARLLVRLHLAVRNDERRVRDVDRDLLA